MALSNSLPYRHAFCWYSVNRYKRVTSTYRQVSNIRRTKSQNLNASRLILQFFCAIYGSQVLSREWRCSWNIYASRVLDVIKAIHVRMGETMQSFKQLENIVSNKFIHWTFFCTLNIFVQFGRDKGMSFIIWVCLSNSPSVRLCVSATVFLCLVEAKPLLER